MPRLFTGLEIPSDVGFALSLKRGGLNGARWIDPENYHITLRFIGDVDNQTANEVVDNLDYLSESLRFPMSSRVPSTRKRSAGSSTFAASFACRSCRSAPAPRSRATQRRCAAASAST